MKLVLDTNAYCLSDVGSESALEALEEAHSLFLPSIVYGELYYGFQYGSKLRENIKRLNRFIEEFQVTLIAVDQEVATKYGDIYASLRKKGKPIPTNDLWISACCMSVGGTLLTEDQHFKAVDQIQIRWITP